MKLKFISNVNVSRGTFINNICVIGLQNALDVLKYFCAMELLESGQDRKIAALTFSFPCALFCL